MRGPFSSMPEGSERPQDHDTVQQVARDARHGHLFATHERIDGPQFAVGDVVHCTSPGDQDADRGAPCARASRRVESSARSSHSRQERHLQSITGIAPTTVAIDDLEGPAVAGLQGVSAGGEGRGR